MSELDGTDIQHHSQLNNLDTDYGNKASKMVFDNTALELRTLDENHDMRLDELEKRFSTIHTDLYETVVQELDQKIDSAEFNQMISQINVGQTGLAQDIAGLLMESQMVETNTEQDAAIALKADKAEFDTASADISSRHLDIEKRLLAVDQFFRLMAKTYKIYDNAGEIKYDASIKASPSERLFTVTRKKTGRISLSLTRFAYNIFTNKISVFNANGDELGFGNKSNFSALTLSGDIVISSNLSFPLKVKFLNRSGDVLYEESITSAEYSALLNPSVISISYGTAKEFTVGQSFTINPTTWTGPIGNVSVSLPAGWTIVNGVITGTASTAGSFSYTITATSQDGTETSTATLLINVYSPPIVSYTVPTNLKTGDAISISPTNT